MSEFSKHYQIEQQIAEAMEADGTRADMYPELYGTLYAILVGDHDELIDRALNLVLERHTTKEVSIG